jgi:hypothetical protein
MLSGSTHDMSPLQISMQAQVGFVLHPWGVETQWYDGGTVSNVAQDNPAAVHTLHEATSEQSSTFAQPPA